MSGTAGVVKSKWPRAAAIGAVVFVMVLLLAWRSSAAAPAWEGVDEAVIGRFVREAGRPEPTPIIDWIHGDALLFAFLCAGLVAGFCLGFVGRAVFFEQGELSKPRRSFEDRAVSEGDADA